MRKPPEERKFYRDFLGGMLLVFLLHCLVWTIAYAILGSTDFFILAALLAIIGVTQLIYLAPITIYFTLRDRKGIVKGIISAGLMTLAINGTCFAGMNIWPILILIPISIVILLIYILIQLWLNRD